MDGMNSSSSLGGDLQEINQQARGLKLPAAALRAIKACSLAAQRIQYAGFDQAIQLKRYAPETQIVSLTRGKRPSMTSSLGGVATDKQSSVDAAGFASAGLRSVGHAATASPGHHSLAPGSFASKSEVVDAHRVVALAGRVVSIGEIIRWTNIITRTCLGSPARVDLSGRRPDSRSSAGTSSSSRSKASHKSARDEDQLEWMARLVGQSHEVSPASGTYRHITKMTLRESRTPDEFSSISTDVELLSYIAPSRLPNYLRKPFKIYGCCCLKDLATIRWRQRGASVADRDSAIHEN